MVFKPDASHQRKSVPSKEQIVRAAKLIKGYKGKVSIEVESCFSQLRALVLNSYFMNRNVGIERGCGAGRDAVSINVEGKITPCRHIELEETYQSIADYWENSRVLQKLRHVEESKRRPCSDCRFQKNCLPCAAVNLKLFGEIYMGEEGCRLGYDSAEKSKKTGE
jgi:pyrroloquinoline quinone biosynthesis protein E